MAFPSKLPSPRLSRWIGPSFLSQQQWPSAPGLLPPSPASFPSVSHWSQRMHTLSSISDALFLLFPLPRLLPKGCAGRYYNYKLTNEKMEVWRKVFKHNLRQSWKRPCFYGLPASGVPKVPMNISTLVLKVSWIKCFLFQPPKIHGFPFLCKQLCFIAWTILSLPKEAGSNRLYSVIQPNPQTFLATLYKHLRGGL